MSVRSAETRKAFESWDLDDEDSLAVIAVVPRDELGDESESESPESDSPPPVSEVDSTSTEPESGAEENGN